MTAERDDARVIEAVESVCPEFTPALRQRVLSAIAVPARVPARPRRRLIAVAVGAAALLAGLGFVPLPLGRTHGVLTRAVAAMSAGQSMHVTARGWLGGDEYRFEEWSAADGSMRYEKWKNGELSFLIVNTDDLRLDYNAPPGMAYEYDMPPMPGRKQILTGHKTRAGLQKTMAFVQDHLDGGEVSEWRERSLWGGEIEVMEVEGTVAAGTVISGVPYDSAGTVIVRGEVDPQTDHVVSLREYLKMENGRQLVFETQIIEWGAEIPDSVWKFQPPAGTKLERSMWWTGRADRDLAAGQSGDWRVVLHAVDVAHNGDVVLTLSRWLPEGEAAIARRPETPHIEAEDDRGCTYSQDAGFGCSENPSGGYWVTTLHPATSQSVLPNAITVTIGSPVEAEQGHPPVTFRTLPLPPRQEADDLFKAATEVVQY